MMKTLSSILINIIITLFLVSIAGSCLSPVTAPLELSFMIDGNNVSRTVISGHILGGNLGAWAHMDETGGNLAPPVPGYVTALGPGVFRFPGGNISNHFCWKEQQVWNESEGKWDPWSWGTDVYEYMDFLDVIGCVPMFSINPFDHTIGGVDHFAVDEAEDLVELFNTRGFSGAFYELGNENDGEWNPMLSIAEYTARFIECAEAMKAIDPDIAMMGPVIAGYKTDWIDGFLEGLDAAGKLSLLDYFSFHHYGGWISNNTADGINLDDPQELGSMISYIRDKSASLGAPDMKVALTEYNAAIWDSGCDRGKFTIEQGLWIADAAGMLFCHADMANIWITIHPGSDPHTLIASETTPPVPTKNYWPYYCVVKALSGATPADEVDVLSVDPGVSTSVVTTYSVKKADNSVGILVCNKAPRYASCEMNLINTGGVLSATVYTLDEAGYNSNNGPEERMLPVDDGQVTVTLPPLSVAAVLLE